MVWHETVGVDYATRGQRTPEFVFWRDHVMEDEDELPVIVFVFEDLLPVYASEHHVVDAVLTL